MRAVKRIGINIGGYVAGINAVIAGTALAAHDLGWEVIGIRDGFDGLLFPERYPDGGLVKLALPVVENLSAGDGAILGNATRTDPFRVRQVNAENMVEEVDCSGDLIARIAAEKIDAVISVLGPRALSISFRLHRQGLRTVCVPTSIENDVAATDLSFGFNSALSFAVDMLERVRQAAQSARKIGVVEVLGEHAGWLALQAGIAVCADAVLIPEIPYNLQKVAKKLTEKLQGGRGFGLVVVAEGAGSQDGQSTVGAAVAPNSLKTSLSPGATGERSSHVIESAGQAAHAVALILQRLTDRPAYPLVLGQLVKGGAPTAVDRQLGLAYGAGAVRALQENQTVPANSVFVQTARSLGIALGD